VSDTEPIRSALATLGPADREILRLCGWEELTPEEIAAVLGISRIAARSRLHRARRRLRAALADASQTEASNVSALQEVR
jgi:RNA polymerase sigma-70 factor (ECF subfamily)